MARVFIRDRSVNHQTQRRRTRDLEAGLRDLHPKTRDVGHQSLEEAREDLP